MKKKCLRKYMTVDCKTFITLMHCIVLKMYYSFSTGNIIITKKYGISYQFLKPKSRSESAKNTVIRIKRVYKKYYDGKSYLCIKCVVITNINNIELFLAFPIYRYELYR